MTLFRSFIIHIFLNDQLLLILNSSPVISVVSVDMATLSIKPGLRCTVSDWMNTNNEISVTAEQRRHLSHEIRQEGRALCNDTTNKVVYFK